MWKNLQKYFTSINQSTNYRAVKNKTKQKVALIFQDYQQLPDSSDNYFPLLGPPDLIKLPACADNLSGTKHPRLNSTCANSIKLYQPWICKLGQIKDTCFFLRVKLSWITWERNHLPFEYNYSLFLCPHCLH